MIGLGIGVIILAVLLAVLGFAVHALLWVGVVLVLVGIVLVVVGRGRRSRL